MTTLAPLTLGRFFGSWEFDPWSTGLVVVLLAGYLFGVRAARRRDVRWSGIKVAAFVILGLGAIVVSTMSSLAVYSPVLFWPMALRATLLLTIAPVGFGLSDPIGLVTAALTPAGAARWQDLLRAWPVRVLTFPAVAPVLALVTLLAIFFTGYLEAALRHNGVMQLLELQLVGTGCLFTLPLLGVEVLPVWCTQPVRMMIAGVDSLLDAVPGIAVMTTHSLIASGYYGTVNRGWGPSHDWDQTIGGGLMLTVAEIVAIPFIAVLYRAWIKEDAWHAREIDHALDLAEARRVALTDAEEQPADRPWWEVDPGPLADRAARYGWTASDPRQEKNQPEE